VAAGAVGAALALARLRRGLRGKLEVIGLPADELFSPLAVERGGGKTRALEAGHLSGIDYFLYAHPESLTGVWPASKPLPGVDSVKPDPKLAGIVTTVLAQLGLDPAASMPPMPFSTDFGNVSQRIPAVMVGVAGPVDWEMHTAVGASQFTSAQSTAFSVVLAKVLAAATHKLIGKESHDAATVA
jgi:metal-dependent amidase/aminoacylase/carboxypeptidase family protein